jgi:hypothetical protein
VLVGPALCKTKAAGPFTFRSLSAHDRESFSCDSLNHLTSLPPKHQNACQSQKKELRNSYFEKKEQNKELFKTAKNEPCTFALSVVRHDVICSYMVLNIKLKL